MKSVKFGTMGMLVGAVALTTTGAALAQDASAQVGAGATATTTTTTTVAPAPAPASAPPAPPTQTGMALPGAAPDAAPVGATDHDAVVGHFGIGYMGRRSIGINIAAGGGVTTVDAPVIGVRYWFDPMVGLDLGLGMLLSTGSVKNDPGGASQDLQGYTVFMVHGGVPLALAGGKHFSFQIVPELNFGLASSTIAGGAGGGADTDLSGLHLDIGARAGAEVQFGFIGIPELSLQAGVGLALALDRVKATNKTNPETSTTVSQTSLGTSVGDNPWNIFTGNVAALYYFD